MAASGAVGAKLIDLLGVITMTICPQYQRLLFHQYRISLYFLCTIFRVLALNQNIDCAPNHGILISKLPQLVDTQRECPLEAQG